MVGSWRWNMSATGSENALDSLSHSGTFAHSYNSSISGRRLSFSGTYARSNGNAVKPEQDRSAHRCPRSFPPAC